MKVNANNYLDRIRSKNKQSNILRVPRLEETLHWVIRKSFTKLIRQPDLNFEKDQPCEKLEQEILGRGI